MNRIIDNAALFPPAQRSMQEALQIDTAARAAPYGAMIGLFLVPASRLAELSASTPSPPPIAVVLDRHLEVALRLIDAESRLPIIAIETPRGADATRGEMIEMLGAWSSRDGGKTTIYCEVVAETTAISRVDDAIERIALLRRSSKNFAAKMRAGGALRKTVPDVEIVAHTFEECARYNVPLKATAGLHNAVRRIEDGVAIHGFLNLLLAAAIATRDSEAHDAIVAALLEEDPAAFVLDDDALVWRDRRFGAATLAAMRLELLNSFGSCDPDEPTDSLRALALLE